MASASIHPTAIIGKEVELAEGVNVGPYCVIDGRVSIGPETRIAAHSVIEGRTTIGAKCRIGPAAFVGLEPQHLKFDASVETCVVIGDGCILREGSSVHRATSPGIEHATRLGERCFMMSQSHVGHDCRLGSDVILASGALLGGHVIVGAGAFLGGGAVVHQFCQIGRLVIVRGNDAISKDVPPFAAVAFGRLKAYNAIGCRRAGISPAAIRGIRQAFHQLQNNRTTNAAVEAIRQIEPMTDEVQEILAFIAGSRRGIQPSNYAISNANSSGDDV